jgi:hypothetical protein
MKCRAGWLLVLLVALGCTSMAEPPTEKDGDGSTGRKKTDFAIDREVKSPEPAAFDAKRAMDYLKEVCKIGPRQSGTDGMKKQQELLKKHFEKLGGKVTFQKFKAKQKSQTDEVEMANMVVSWYPERKRRVILCSHYDTRPIADQEPDERNWRKPFVSANDGGSGVALLMELANHVKKLKTQVGIDFVLFDGEEYIFKRGDDYFFGSKHFATLYRRNKPKERYVGAVLLDMIGGKTIRFPVEVNSWNFARGLVNEIWETARGLNVTAFEFKAGPTVEDDHLALNGAGIPCVDVIDFDYKHWHRLTDTPENCSGESMAKVAKVLSVWLQKKK